MSSYDPASSRHRERRYDPEYEAELDAFNRAVLRAVGKVRQLPATTQTQTALTSADLHPKISIPPGVEVTEGILKEITFGGMIRSTHSETQEHMFTATNIVRAYTVYTPRIGRTTV
jgi:hypothetical protein